MMGAVVVVDDAVITVRGHQVRECLRRAGMRPIYVHGRGAQGWVLDRKRAGDAVAALERGGYEVRFEGEASADVASVDPLDARPGTTTATEDVLW